MAMNPMQKKAQNSFLLGMLITLLITGIIIGLLVVQLTKITKEQKEREASLKQVYVVSEDISSGDVVTTDKLKSKLVDSSLIPNNALDIAELEAKSNVTDDDDNLIKKVNIISKINLKAGTVITADMVKIDGELSNDVRKVECTAVTLASQLESGKYIDVRLRLPSGTDYIVVSHKQIEIPEIDGVPSTDTMWLQLSEDEILMLNCAIVESYKIPGSLLYAVEYIEPGLQEKAVVSYSPNDDVYNLIQKDPNCVETAINEIKARNRSLARNSINSELNNNKDELQEDTITGVEEEIKKIQEERQEYIDSLGG